LLAPLPEMGCFELAQIQRDKKIDEKNRSAARDFNNVTLINPAFPKEVRGSAIFRPCLATGLAFSDNFPLNFRLYFLAGQSLYYITAA
jgi:hypothetical protein